jgi:hypothetical protein
MHTGAPYRSKKRRERYRQVWPHTPCVHACVHACVRACERAASSSPLGTLCCVVIAPHTMLRSSHPAHNALTTPHIVLRSNQIIRSEFGPPRILRCVLTTPHTPSTHMLGFQYAKGVALVERKCRDERCSCFQRKRHESVSVLDVNHILLGVVVQGLGCASRNKSEGVAQLHHALCRVASGVDDTTRQQQLPVHREVEAKRGDEGSKLDSGEERLERD